MVGSRVMAAQGASRKHIPPEDNFCYLVRSMFQRKSTRGEQELHARWEKVDHYISRMKAFVPPAS